jgi:HAMP domain-containing protein
MKTRRIYQSLRFKITAGITIPLLIILTIVSYLQYSSHRDLMMDNLRLSASNLGEIIEGSLQHAMLTNDFSEVQGIVNEIAEREEVKGLFLLDNKGRIVISTDQKRVGTTMDLGDATCQSCHERKAVDRSLTCIFTTDQEERVFRNLNPIENREECQGCHEVGEKVLGVLITDFSMATIDRHLAADRRNGLLWSIGTVAVVILVVGLTMNRLVVTRLERFVEAIKSLSRGDLDQKVAIESDDEIGELALTFNNMAEGLREKAKLEQKVRQRTEELQAQTERLFTLNTIAATVSRSLNLEEILDSALEKVLELMKLKAGWVFLPADEGRELHLAVHRGLSEEFASQEMERKLGKCIC